MIPFVVIFSSLVDHVLSTPSVFACPFTVMGPQMAFNMGAGETCPRPSFLHYYNCCEDNLFQCCFHFETWTIVIFSLLCIGIIAGIIFWAARMLLSTQD